jgi:transposase
VGGAGGPTAATLTRATTTATAAATCARRGIKVRIARRDVESSERLGRHRWKAERTIAWLFGCRRLRVRYDRGSERFYAFGLLACCRLSFNRYTNQATQRPERPLLAW